MQYNVGISSREFYQLLDVLISKCSHILLNDIGKHEPYVSSTVHKTLFEI